MDLAAQDPTVGVELDGELTGLELARILPRQHRALQMYDAIVTAIKQTAAAQVQRIIIGRSRWRWSLR